MGDDARQAVIGPAEFAILIKVYNNVLPEPWFATDEAQRGRFRRYIIKAFRAGITEPGELTTHCREFARHHYSALGGSPLDG